MFDNKESINRATGPNQYAPSINLFDTGTIQQQASQGTLCQKSL
jgi:hypothetical protein